MKLNFTHICRNLGHSSLTHVWKSETSFFYKNRPKTHVFTQKISELFAWNSGNREASFTKTGQFHAKRVSFTQNGKFTQKISKLSKKSVIIFWRPGQFHAKTLKYATKLVSAWSKLPRFLGRHEVLIEIVKCMVNFLTMKLPVSRNETGKKVTFARLQNHTVLDNFVKNHACFQSYPSISDFYRFCETGLKYNETGSKYYEFMACFL